MADLDPLSFEGTSPKECEVFVSTIRQRAFAQGKHRDNEWIAFLASSFFVGDAFYWYEELEAGVQNDWSRLRPALVARFGRRGSTSATTSSPSTIPASARANSIPTPAAAPPTAVPSPSFRKGHLKVLKSDGSLRGYLAKQPDSNDHFNGLSPRLGDALLVSFPVLSAGETLEIQIISGNASQRSQASNFLALIWHVLRGSQWVDKPWVAAWCCSSLTVAEWAKEQKVWKISNEGELSVEYPKPNGEIERLHCCFDPDVRFRKSVPAKSKRARIVFEDVV